MNLHNKICFKNVRRSRILFKYLKYFQYFNTTLDATLTCAVMCFYARSNKISL